TAPSRSFSFPQLFTATLNSPGYSDRNALIERAIQLLLISQVCSDGRLGSKMVPVLPWVPTLLRHLPTDSTPSSRPDTSPRPGDPPWRASCRRGAVGRPCTLWVHRRMPDCEPGQERRNSFSCPF